jgi:hypothetical protein
LGHGYLPDATSQGAGHGSMSGRCGVPAGNLKSIL